MPNIIHTITYYRSFGNEPPRYIKNALNDDELEKLKGKDFAITSTHEIEILDKVEKKTEKLISDKNNGSAIKKLISDIEYLENKLARAKNKVEASVIERELHGMIDLYEQLIKEEGDK